MSYFYVFIGGGLGSLLRFTIGLFINKIQPVLPLATFISNTLSCLLFAFILYVYHQKNTLPDAYKHLILIGLCGGLSTFSTFSFETFELLKSGMFMWAIINILFSIIMCVGLFFVFARA